MPTLAESQTKTSPFESLNEDFRQKNGRLEELIMRLRDKGHKLSDTTLPAEPSKEGAKVQELPFRSGHLMYYFDQLTRNEMLLNCLLEEVNKIEGLI